MRRILWAYATTYLGVFTSLVSTLWLLQLVTDSVDPATFGLYAYFNQIGLTLGLILLGLDGGVSIRTAQALSRGDVYAAARMHYQLRTVSLYCVALGIAATAALATGTYWTEPDPSQRLLKTRLILIIGCTQSAVILSRVAISTLLAGQHMVRANLVKSVQQALALLIGYLLFSSGWGILCIPAAELAATLLVTSYLIRSYRGHCPWSRMTIDRPWEGFKGLLRYGGMLQVIGLCGMIDGILEALMIRSFSEDGLKAYGIFTVWNRFPMMGMALCNSLMNVSAITLAASMAQDRHQGLVLARRLIWVLTVLTCASLFCVGIWLAPFIRNWYGIQYWMDNGAWFAVWLSVGTALRTLLHGYGVVANASDRPGLCILAFWMFVVVKMFIAYPFIVMEGLMGYAEASLIAAIIACAWIVVALVRGGLAGTPRVVAVCGATSLAVVAVAPLLEGMAFDRMLYGMAATTMLLSVPAAAYLAARRFSTPATK